MKYRNHIRIRRKDHRKSKIGITDRPTFLGKIKFCAGTAARTKKFLKTNFFLGWAESALLFHVGLVGKRKKKGRNAHAHVPMKLPYRSFSCSHEVPFRSRACSPPPAPASLLLLLLLLLLAAAALLPVLRCIPFCVLRGPSPSSAAGPFSSLFLSPLLFFSSSSSQAPTLFFSWLDLLLFLCFVCDRVLGCSFCD